MRAGETASVRSVIYRLSYRRYSLPFKAPVRTAHGPWAVREGLIVRLEASDGAVGFGEVAPIASFGTETVEQAEEILRDLAQGQVSAERLRAVPAKFGCVRGALSAAHAEADKRELGAVKTSALPVAALLSAGRAALEQIETRAEAGFRTFKWKVGVADAADELALLDDVIAKLPGGAKLRLDANGAWDRRRAERWLERCADRPVEFVEQPVAPETKGSQDLLLGLAEDYPTPIALDESVTGETEIEHWLRLNWQGIFVVKVSLLGDAEEALGKLSTAKARVVFSSALETAVGARRALRLAFRHGGEALALGFGVWPLFGDSRFDGPYTAPFIRAEDVERLNPEAVWNALS